MNIIRCVCTHPIHKGERLVDKPPASQEDFLCDTCRDNHKAWLQQRPGLEKFAVVGTPRS